MKKLFLLLSVICITAFAEASFDQIENLIEKQQYAAAEQGLEVIIKNHPNSAKAYYAMAQAQAGLGNQEKARYALDKATGLDPDLKFASSSNVEKLREAITPQVNKIERAEPSHFWRNLVIMIVLSAILYWCYLMYKRNEDEGDKPAGGSDPKPTPPAPESPSDAAYLKEMEEKAKLRAAQQRMAMEAQAAQVKANTTPYQAPSAPLYAQQSPQPTVVHHHHTTTVQNSNDGLLTGVLIGEMLSHPHHETRVVEREVIREVPAPSRDSSWNTPSAPSRSSSWDDSSSSSSSWGSSSSSDSSWSSSSSSDSSWSDSSSSSSWD